MVEHALAGLAALVGDDHAAMELVEKVLDRLPVAVALHVPTDDDLSDFRFVYTNPAREALKPQVTSLGHTFAEIWPELAHLALPRLREVYTTGTPWAGHDLAMEIQSDSGEMETRHYTFQLSRTSIWGRTYLIDISRETTPEVTAREEAAASKQTLEDVLDRITDAIIALDTEWRFTFVSHQAERLLRKSSAELLGRVAWDEFPEAQATTFREQAVRAMEEQAPVSYRDHYPPYDSWFDVRAYPSRSGLSAFFADVTEAVRAEQSLDIERRRLKTILDTLPIGLFVIGREGGIVYTNEQTERIWGGILHVHRAEQFSQYRGWWAESGTRLEAHEWAAARALRGETSLNEVIDIERFDGTRGTILNSAVPIKSAEGDVAGAVVVVQDITEQRERQRLTEALAEIESVASSTLRTDDVLDQVLRLTVEALRADSAVLYSYRNDQWVALRTYGDLEQPVGRALTGEEVAYSKDAARTARRVMEVADAATDERVDHEVAERYDIGALLDAAIIVSDELVGDLTIHFRQSKEAFSEPERFFISEVAFALSRAIAIASQFQNEQEVANALQLALLDTPVQVAGVRFVTDYASASDIAFVGGDFYDVIPLREGKVGIVIGDVSGKALDAAKLTMLAKNAIRAYAFEGSGPSEVMRIANELLFALTDTHIFVTAFTGVLEPWSGTLNYCSAGHPTSFVRRSSGEITRLEVGSPLLGGSAGMEYVQGQVVIGKDDYLFLYTDGAIEARNRRGEFFGEERLAEILRESATGAEACGRAMDAVKAFSGGQFADDLALLTVYLE